VARRPAVISPLAPILHRDVVEIAVSVELWPQQTIVRHFPRGVPEEATRRDVEANGPDGDSGSCGLTLE